MKSHFLWQSEQVTMPKLDYPRLEQWLVRVAADHGMTISRLGYLFCNDDYILDVNRRFLGHDYFTDIITFDYSRADHVGGDMVISLDTVESNSRLVGATYERELLRVIVHGLLHLCGIDDKGPGQREIMEEHEDKALAMWDEMTSIQA